MQFTKQFYGVFFSFPFESMLLNNSTIHKTHCTYIPRCLVFIHVKKRIICRYSLRPSKINMHFYW